MTFSSYPIRSQGLFVGLTTLDLIYRVTSPPQANQKLVASEYVMAAGGPATNAAIAFQYLCRRYSSLESSFSGANPHATLLSVVGCHPLNQMVCADVERWGVAIADLNPAHPDPVPTSSIMVTEATGDRAVVSLNAVKCVATPDQIPASVDEGWDTIGVVLIDGHQMAVGEAIARRAQQDNIPVVIDAGSWKPGFEMVLRYADYVICSANFCPPDCKTVRPSDTIDQDMAVICYLRDLGVQHIAITHGALPITYWSAQQSTPSNPLDEVEPIAVPTIQPVDTLGAGDIFHGAFCYYLLVASQSDPQQLLKMSQILKDAADVASQSCQYFGTRQWME